MRDILFRGKCVDSGEWVYGYYRPCVFGNFPAEPAIIDADELEKGRWAPVRVIPETVGQFIGLTSRKGKKIFEGDIVRTIGYYGNEIGVIRRGEYDVYSRYVFGGYYCVDKTSALVEWTSSLSCEVIGNIHDNPELLEIAE